MCALIKMKKAYMHHLYLLFSVCFVFSTFMPGFALLPFFSRVFGSAPGLYFFLVILYIWRTVGGWLLMLR